MDVFDLRDKLIGDYGDYATSFMNIRDARISQHVEQALAEGRLWPNPQLGLNPAFQAGSSIDELADEGTLHQDTKAIFRVAKELADKIGRPMTLHQHQEDAIRAARANANYVLTTGTGSGKSLSYMIPIVDHVLRSGSGGGVKAIVVYPMNALANSQRDELRKFLNHGPWGAHPPVTFRRYTGQEDLEERQEILDNPPDILLTNYVMLELILTRVRDRKLVEQIGDLRFLVLDELHTYRGRQGADVALLVRRLREASGSTDLLCVGTSATMSTEGDHRDRLARVAGVASTLFGSRVEPENVIGETLKRSTVEQDLEDTAFKSALRERLESGAVPPTDVEAFCADPLSSWIESTFGIREIAGRLERVTPLSIEGKEGGAAELAKQIGLDEAQCADAIRKQLMAGYEVQQPSTGFPVFAFRLHQFISRGDTVYASLQSPADRYLTLTPQRFVPEDRGRSLLPLSFCRSCGQDYYVVALQIDESGSRLVSRDLGDQKGERTQETGFLYLSEERPWPDDEEEVAERLPEEWYEWTPKGKLRLRPNRRNDVPQPLVVHPGGDIDRSDFVPAGSTRGWWLTTPFKFCLHCGVSHDARGGDFGRLSTLGSEGRSTATTILSIASVRHLRASSGLDDEAKKLLSFTDNRQDASLQAGHFNDFVQVTMLRGALHRAVADAGPEGLGYDRVAQAVFDALNLPFEEYAQDPELMFGARSNTNEVFREVLAYRLYLDLRRGWRVNQPNLEQCGLLRVEYESLPDLVNHEPSWSDCHPRLADADPEKRESVARVLLDYLRRELAIKVDLLDKERQEQLQRRVEQRIAQGPWDLSLDNLEYARSVAARSRQAGDNREWLYVSSRGGFGRFLRRTAVLGAEGKLTLEETAEIIEQLFDRLRIAGLVEAVGADNDGSPLFQVPASALRWLAGDGTTPYQDHIRMPNAPEQGLEANAFFVEAYKAVGQELQGVRAHEHTAQVRYDDRIRREEDFRSASLPVLYCSPTMELGVDISQLNVVSLRNVPPTPANYAQRSGRAGRSGQPALVFTYCSTGSSHDQYFFNQPEKMVAGQVEAPRLELSNEDLVRAHVQSVWLSESGLDLKTSMRDVLNLADEVDQPEVHESVAAHLENPDYQARAKGRAETVLADILPLLEDAGWYDDDWIARTLKHVPEQFEKSLERWRTLYKAAMQQAKEQGKVAIAADRSRSDKANARRLRADAERQLDLLRAESDSRGQSDFYTYRYFAAEGFLPGYSFPRLPISAFIPGGRGRTDHPEFLQRPRFLAISEFGPQSLVYHEGERFRINRVILPVGELENEQGGLATQQAKWCDRCGYLHPIVALPGADNCDRCGAILPQPMSNLFRLQNVATQRRDRITSDEEERQRQGYELMTGVHFADRAGKPSVKEAELVDSEGIVLADLAYGAAATIWRVNLGWRRRKDQHRHGFVLDTEGGYWEKSEADHADDENDPTANRRSTRVIPYVDDTRNALLITPRVELDLETMASIESALKQALQINFQLEESEIATEPLPSKAKRKVLLVYESAEGGAGVLRRLIAESALFSAVATEAIRRCHVDPATETEIPARGEDRACAAACYECLMSYRNQPDHDLLDRKLAVPVLRRFEKASVQVTGEKRTEIDAGVESPLEAAFISYLRDGGFREPDRSQVYFEKAGCRPDFVYDEACAVVYIDGPFHDYPDRQDRDKKSDEAMNDLGYKVIRFGHRDDWAQIVDTFTSVFGEGVQN